MITCGLLVQAVIVRKDSRALWDTGLLELTLENINSNLFATLLNHRKPDFSDLFLFFIVLDYSGLYDYKHFANFNKLIWLQCVCWSLVSNEIMSNQSTAPFFIHFSLLKPSFSTDSKIYRQPLLCSLACGWVRNRRPVIASELRASGLCGWYIHNDLLAGTSSIIDNYWAYTAIFSSLGRLMSVFISYSVVSSYGNLLELHIFETRSFCQIWSKLANSFKSYEGGDENWQDGSTSVYLFPCKASMESSFFIFKVDNQNSVTCI